MCMYMCIYVYTYIIYVCVHISIPRCNKAYVCLRDEKTPLYLSRFGSAEKREAGGFLWVQVSGFRVWVFRVCDPKP